MATSSAGAASGLECPLLLELAICVSRSAGAALSTFFMVSPGRRKNSLCRRTLLLHRSIRGAAQSRCKKAQRNEYPALIAFLCLCHADRERSQALGEQKPSAYL